MYCSPLRHVPACSMMHASPKYQHAYKTDTDSMEALDRSKRSSTGIDSMLALYPQATSSLLVAPLPHHGPQQLRP